MPDRSPVTSAEVRTIHYDLLDHVARHLGRLLPEHLAMVAAPEQLLLISATNGPARTIATHSVQAPEHLDLGNIRVVAHHVLADAQDLVVDHLHEPWPTAPDGRSLHASTSVSGRSVRFRSALKNPGLLRDAQATTSLRCRRRPYNPVWDSSSA